MVVNPAPPTPPPREARAWGVTDDAELGRTRSGDAALTPYRQLRDLDVARAPSIVVRGRGPKEQKT
jgi:hypothetical protein